jgi:hypothetical protein
MRLSQNGKRSRMPGLNSPGTLTLYRRWRSSTLPVKSSPWNSVSPLVFWRVNQISVPQGRRIDQRVKDRGESKGWIVMVRTGDNVLHPKGALTSAWCGMA